MMSFGSLSLPLHTHPNIRIRGSAQRPVGPASPIPWRMPQNLRFGVKYLRRIPLAYVPALLSMARIRG